MLTADLKEDGRYIGVLAVEMFGMEEREVPREMGLPPDHDQTIYEKWRWRLWFTQAKHEKDSYNLKGEVELKAGLAPAEVLAVVLHVATLTEQE